MSCKIPLVGRYASHHSFSDFPRVQRALGNLILGYELLTQFNHDEFIRVPQHARLRSWAKLSGQSVVPVRIGLIDKSFRPHAYDRKRHLVTKKGVSVEAPIELIHLR